MANSIFLLDAHKGLGTAFWVELFLHESEQEGVPLEKIQKHLIQTIEEFEAKYSRFKKDSLLNELNSKRTIPYDEDMGKMLTQAQKVSHHTDGVFSLFIKEALEEKGYGEKTSNMEQLPFSEEKNEILISADSISITGNKGIDLGGIGKGYLIDKLATLLKEEYGLPYFLINGGGDIYVTSDREKEIQLFLEHPVHDGEYINAIAIKNKAFCSSSSFKRRWNKDGKEVNHFIASNEVWAASYCIGETATITDMYATVFCIIANKKDTLEKIAISQHIDYCVIGDDGKIVISKRFPSFL